jgi:hypothetical protein
MWTYIDDGEWICLIFDDAAGRFRRRRGTATTCPASWTCALAP